jgi:hypothetical protein
MPLSSFTVLRCLCWSDERLVTFIGGFGFVGGKAI